MDPFLQREGIIYAIYIVSANVRNLVLEKIANTVSFPCKYASNGCPSIMSHTQKADHEDLCEFRFVVSGDLYFADINRIADALYSLNTVIAAHYYVCL